MKIQLILISILLFFSIGLCGQIDNTIDKSTGILYFSGIPGTTPNTAVNSYESEIAFNMLNGELWIFNRDSTSWKRATGIEKGFGDPVDDPGIYAKTYVNLTDGSLWRWNGLIWINAFASGGGGVSDGDKGDITVSGSGTVWTINNNSINPDKLESTTVVSGAYTNADITIDEDGRITAAANGVSGGGADSSIFSTNYRRDTAIQAVRNEVNNKLYQAATYTNITTLNFPTLAVGDRIKVMDTGAEYLVEATTVSDYNGGSADEINVITVGSNYAVIDLSKKVKFESKEEFKRLASLMRLDGSNFQVEIGGLNYLISTAIPYLSSVHTAIEPAVDGLFIDTINVAFAGENLAPYSSVFHNKGSAYGAVFTGDGFIRGKINPEGKRTSSGLLGDASLFLYSTDAGLPAYPTGQDITVSVWARATNGSGTSQIKLGQGANQNVTNEWVRYTETFNNSIGAYVQIRANNSLTDTVLIDKVQIETGTELTAYKETTFLNRATSGLMYMTLLKSVIEEGVLKLDKLGGRNSSTNSSNYDDTDLIQSAIDMCDYGKVCNVVQLGKAAYTIDSITVSANVALRGTQSEYSNIDNDKQTGTIIYLKNPLGKLSAIDFQEQNGDNYISGTGLKNVLLVALDTFDTIIELEECVFSEFDNISINTESNGHFNKGIDINTLPSSDSYNLTFNEIAITGDYDIGIEYSGQTNNVFSNLSLKNALEAGIHVLNGVNVEVNNALIQGCKQAIIVDQQRGLAKFNGLYTEASGYGSSAIEINGGKVLIENSPALQPDLATDTIINHQGGILKIINSNFRVGGVLNVSSDIDKLVLDNVTSNFDLYHSIPPELLKEKVEILNNFDGNDYSIKYKDNITPSIIRNSYIKEATNSNVILSDTVTINDIYLAGKKENLVQNSDDLDIGVFGSSNITGTDEVIVDPFGNSSTVQKYQWDASFVGTIAGPNDNISPNIDIGDQYVLSFYIKSDDVIGSRKLFKVRPYNDAANDVDMYVNLSNKWQRISVTGTINSKVSNVLSFRFYDALEIGESFYLTGVQIEKGTQFGTYIQTLGTEIESTAIEITTDGIGINTEPDSTAVLDIASTSKGVLIPRMTTAQRELISTPAAGLQIYNTEDSSQNYYNGDRWINKSENLDIKAATTEVIEAGTYHYTGTISALLSFTGTGQWLITTDGSVGTFSLIEFGGNEIINTITGASGDITTTPGATVRVISEDGSTYYATIIDDSGALGWEFIQDSEWTTSNRLTDTGAIDTITLTNNGGTLLNRSQLPVYIDSLWNRNTDVFQPVKDGDAYQIRIDFTAESDSNNDDCQFLVDIGGTPDIIIGRRIVVATAPKRFSVSFNIVSLATFVANGGQFRIAEGTGNLEIWDIGFLIEKTHHAR